MMKIKLLLVSTLVVFTTTVWAAVGFFGRQIIYAIGSGSNQSASVGTNLGTVNVNSTFILKGAGSNTFKNSGGNICGPTLYYRIYTSGSPSGSFSSFSLPFKSENANGGGGTDQYWESTAQSISLTGGRTAGTYTIEIYLQSTGCDACGNGGCGQTYFDSNGGSNYTFTYTLTGSLPVSLISFTAQKTEEGSNLIWQTVSELNNSYFEVERSANLAEWHTLARIDGQGTSAQSKTYTYLDKTPFKGVNYYRLKQVDQDGQFSFSKTRDIIIEQIPKVSVFPNPSINQFTVSGLSQMSEVSVLDGQGIVRWQKSLLNDSTIDLSILSEGTYWIRITNANVNHTQKIKIIR